MVTLVTLGWRFVDVDFPSPLGIFTIELECWYTTQSGYSKWDNFLMLLVGFLVQDQNDHQISLLIRLVFHEWFQHDRWIDFQLYRFESCKSQVKQSCLNFKRWAESWEIQQRSEYCKVWLCSWLWLRIYHDNQPNVGNSKYTSPMDPMLGSIGKKGEVQVYMFALTMNWELNLP